jgi:hypothetical protein
MLHMSDTDMASYIIKGRSRELELRTGERQLQILGGRRLILPTQIGTRHPHQ